jgi:hypothetical protein
MQLLLSIIIGLLCFVQPVYAKYDPTTVPNNKYGIHIVDVNDISDAANLINSSGGDWGYVTVVIQEDNRDFEKWQRVFNQMREQHLIPIVRLSTHIEGDSWSIPSRNSADDWARFLNSLNWPTENRYVIVFNEPNHANEWGKFLDPEGYADILDLFGKTLHKTSEDFFVMAAGFDVSAASDGRSLDAATYITRMVSHNKSVFDTVDGWASHAYPNPAFSGSPYSTGRGTLYSYTWERSLLQSLGVSKNLPVFITETGWIHSEGVIQNPGLLTSAQVGNNLKIASSTVWQDPGVVAITPFVLNYQGLPFDHFSWRKLGASEFYPMYGAYQEISKIAGTPKQREHFSLDGRLIPKTLIAGSTYTLQNTIKNTGQSILTEQDGYTLRLTTPGKFTVIYDPLPILEPNQSGLITAHIETPQTTASYTYTLELLHHGFSIPIETGSVQIVPPPSISVSAQLGWRTANTASDATVLVYDDKTLLHKVNGVELSSGHVTVSGLRNIVPGKKYRVVMLVPYYLPRQRIVTLTERTTNVSIPRMIPVDFDKDGAFAFSDLTALVQLKPNFIISLFIGP